MSVEGQLLSAQSSLYWNMLYNWILDCHECKRYWHCHKSHTRWVGIPLKIVGRHSGVGSTPSSLVPRLRHLVIYTVVPNIVAIELSFFRGFKVGPDVVVSPADDTLFSWGAFNNNGYVLGRASSSSVRGCRTNTIRASLQRSDTLAYRNGRNPE
ncbi:hypothetical protein L195_g026691 [Trifolium pratense]|uniref:Uncharacterized protein n=1 Tax=Trifolium pratense TaxID=57577 RepID=A0A2K3NK03_TRIPR|nr:hypothetical protein L195_g026691 [Trifolium pratense]